LVQQQLVCKGTVCSQISARQWLCAPPLDGIVDNSALPAQWLCATIEALLNSKLRPAYWTRISSIPNMTMRHLGWKYETLQKP